MPKESFRQLVVWIAPLLPGGTSESRLEQAEAGGGNSIPIE